MNNPVDGARALVRSRADHLLPITARAAILASLGPLDRPGGAGHMLRTSLAVRAARRALAAHGHDVATTAALDLAPNIWRVVNGHARALEILTTEGNEARDALRSRPTDRLRAARAAAFEALSVGIRDEIFAYPPAIDVDTADAQLGGDDLDAAGAAAVAVAGVVGAADDDPAARLAFWEWYLGQLGG